MCAKCIEIYRLGHKIENSNEFYGENASDQTLGVYELNPPTPFLALRTIKQLAEDERSTFPLAAEYAKTDIVRAGGLAWQRRGSFYSELVGLFRAGGFDLLKWCTNNKTLWHGIPQNARSSQAVEFRDTSDIHASSKVLGLKWNHSCDTFSFSINIPDLWLSKIDWDESLPPHIEKRWSEFHNELHLIEQLHIPRYVGLQGNSGVSLIGFSDASSKRLGAMV
ncbi:hypothetical protein NQ315_008908 [Exocentrus adspersus]|uniref:Uncharacterized protein n=1 Tax=Exocentrus adspersus TaxID=1586481 RepID=A0AAV8V6T3_9CUCU|nr:hypothetical protein NQ315_008908 [Exocentrus adspersus]